MDAETRRTLAATVLSTLVRVSFVFLALRQYDRENGASAQKNKRERNERERGGKKGGGGGKIKSFLILSISVKNVPIIRSQLSNT